MENKVSIIKKIYLYTFSAVGLILLTVGSVQIINLALKSFVFIKADYVVVYPTPTIEKMKDENGNVISNEEYNKKMKIYQDNELASRRQRQASSAVAMIIVGLPLFLYHWKLLKKD